MTSMPCSVCEHRVLSTDLKPCPTCFTPVCLQCIVPHEETHRPKHAEKQKVNPFSKPKKEEKEERGSRADA